MNVPVLPAIVAMAGVTHCPADLSPIDSLVSVPWPPVAPVTTEVVPAPPEEQDPVSELLEALERGADDLSTFTASIRYETEDALLGDVVIRIGRLVYTAEPGGEDRRVAILFDEQIANSRKRPSRKHYVFSGRWLIEVDHEQKLFIKREIAAPGETFDPLKLGEGPLPIPIGQPADEVLARFEVALLELPDEGPLSKLKGGDPVDGLRLVPRPETPAAEDVARIDLFYDRRTRLPVGVNLVEVNGDRKTARLGEHRRNEPLTDGQRSDLSVEEPDPARWHIDVRPLGK